MILLDVASRRIAWDPAKRCGGKLATADRRSDSQSYTTVREPSTRGQSLDALQNVSARQGPSRPSPPPPPPAAVKFEAPKATFEDNGCRGRSLANVIGGAIDQAAPQGRAEAPDRTQRLDRPSAIPCGMSSLMAAKRRAQQKIKEKEEGK